MSDIQSSYSSKCQDRWASRSPKKQASEQLVKVKKDRSFKAGLIAFGQGLASVPTKIGAAGQAIHNVSQIVGGATLLAKDDFMEGFREGYNSSNK